MAVILLLLTLQGIPSVAPTGTLHSPRVKESSGIAASRAHVGVLWTHNDSGDDAYVYATDLAGADRGVVRIRGARAVDWEDIALGPCPTGRGTYLYIADTGEAGRLMPSGRPVCNITGLEVQGEAIDFLDDSTFVVTSEADGRGRGSIHTVRCPQ